MKTKLSLILTLGGLLCSVLSANALAGKKHEFKDSIGEIKIGVPTPGSDQILLTRIAKLLKTSDGVAESNAQAGVYWALIHSLYSGALEAGTVSQRDNPDWVGFEGKLIRDLFPGDKEKKIFSSSLGKYPTFKNRHTGEDSAVFYNRFYATNKVIEFVRGGGVYASCGDWIARLYGTTSVQVVGVLLNQTAILEDIWKKNISVGDFIALIEDSMLNVAAEVTIRDSYGTGVCRWGQTKK